MHPAPGSDSASTAKYRSIAADLAQKILDGQLSAGEKLPAHRVLAHTLGVTPATVSRAYTHLEQQGLATARVGDGTYVRVRSSSLDDAEPEPLAAPIDLAHNVAIPTDEVNALAQVFAELGQDPARMAQLLAYQSEAGAPQHRQTGAAWLRRFGTSGAWSRVMVTHGAQHGLAGVLRTMARPGDTLLTESLSYPGLLALARSMRLQVIGLEMDAEGLLPDALDKAAQTYQAKLLYCSPTLHNPTGRSMSMARREALAAVVRRRGLWLMEDVVHAAVLQQPPPAVSTLVPEQSFLLASLSKVMAPGLRVGYLEAAPEWLDKVAASIRTDCWMVAPLMPEIASRWIDSGAAERLIGLQRQHIGARLALAHQCLAGLDYHWSADHPHLWFPLPEPWHASQFASALRRAGVLVRTAEQFAAGRSRAPHAIRISLNTASSAEQLGLGLRTLVRVLHSDPQADMAP
ncbi:PLP-dependent aminotransferase family protein [Rhodoferax sp.]|uniref:aminotransferase-like domain-containing protein n=1 Tax=Rhodoferax sp. TaxID=50421 RepID=UPI00374CC65A